MHPAQVKAVFAMIDSIENQCRYVKSLLLMNEAVEAPKAPAPTFKAEPAYVSEEEEEEMGRKLEEERIEMARIEAERVQTNWAKQREIVAEEAGF